MKFAPCRYYLPQPLKDFSAYPERLIVFFKFFLNTW